METARLLTALRAADPQLTPLEAAEALWLACAAGPLAGSARRVEAGTVPADEDDTPDPASPSPCAERPKSPAATERTSVRVPTDPGPSAQLAEGSPVSVPDASALPSSRAVQRALKPLKRRVPTARRLVLDEEATAQAIAETGTWAPVFRPASEKWLDLALVVEATPSMVPWDAMIDDLQKSLVQLGAFRDVRRWEIHASRRHPGLGVSRENRTPEGADARADRKPSELTDPSGRRMFFVVTDATSVSWRDGEGGKVLGSWSRHSPVVVLQPLPERLWHRTGLRTRQGTFHSTVPGGSTKDLRFVERRRRPRPLRPDETAVPVVEITPSWLRSWCSMVTGAYGDTTALAAAVVSATGNGGGALSAMPAEGGTADELLRRFQATASPQAFRLATLLSAVPLEPAVIRLVQRTMLPDSGPTHLAEVLLAGIVQAGAGGPAGYEFRPGVRGLLLDDLRVSEANQIVEAVSAYIESRGGLPGRAFPAVAALPGGAPSPVAGEPFAWVPADALHRLGLATESRAERPGAEAPAEADRPSDLRQRLPFLPDDLAVMVVAMFEEMVAHAPTVRPGSSAKFRLCLSFDDFRTIVPYMGDVRRELTELLTEAVSSTEVTVDPENAVRIDAETDLTAGHFRVEPLSEATVTTGQTTPPSAEYPDTPTVARFEGRLELLVGGDHRKAFKGVVHPVEILQAMQRETEEHRAPLAGGRTLVPNRFLVGLSPYDHARLAHYAAALAHELAQSEAEFIGEKNYVVYHDVIVEMEREEGLDSGMFRVTAEVLTEADDTQRQTNNLERGPALAVGEVPQRETGASFLSRLWGNRQSRRNAYEQLNQRLDNQVGGSWSTTVGEVIAPDELLRAMWDEAGSYTSRLAGRKVPVPGKYLIDLPQRDIDRLSFRLGTLAHELARAIVELIAERPDWTLQEGVVVEIALGAGLRAGSFRVQAEHRSSPSARAIPNHQAGTSTAVQPVQVLNALQREAEANKSVLPEGRILVPNHYMVELSPEDHTRLARRFPSLAQEFAQTMAGFVGEQRFTIYGDLLVEIERGDDLETGFFRVTAEVSTGQAE
ncbi:DUF3662 domain-containing protein [Actinoplanes sp. LDG1-06]|uniref:DUF3662 domain-containing protein n=1 Tax=Paractinoplanes ovalisporus TaxID=2810368 RepID=A0ABS2AAG5_9ACTN|nr:DUF3662 domain-containing protein [Actinoplanes ovalisporus]